jgi:outer membrane autotransporter protein
MNVDCCGLGVFGSNRNTITNNGTINLGSFGIAFQVGNDNTIANNGMIIGADGATAMIIGNDNNVTNNGIISVTGSGAFAIQAQTGNTIVNNGTINVDNGGGGIFLFDNSTITNNGLIRATNLSIAVFSPSSTNIVLTNNGTIDGGLILGLCGCGGTNVLNNNGLLTITDANTPVGLPGIFSVGGTYNQSTSGTLAVRVAPGTNINDALTADTVNLNGTLAVVVTAGDYAATTTYQVVLGTTAINGQFAQVTTSAFFDIAATYNPLDVTITLLRRGFANGRGATINQRNVGTALDLQYVPGLTGNAATIFNAVQSASSTTVLDALSGEAAAAAQNGNFAVGGQFLAMMLRQSALARSGFAGGGFARSQDGQRIELASAPAMADASPAQGRGAAAGPLSMWMAGFGGHVSRNGDSAVGAARQSIGFGGVATGVDYRVSRDILIGAAAAASGGGYSVSDRASEGDARNFHVGIYGGFNSGPLYIDGALSYAYGDFTNTRTIAGVGASEQANGAYSGHQFGGRLEAGWRMKLANFGVTPFAGVSAQRLRQTGYSETTRVIATGAPGILGLNVTGQSTWSVRSELGGQIDTLFTLDDGMTIKPRLRLAWAHEFSPDRQVTASLQSLPAASFAVSGARAARDAALVTAGVDLGLSTNVTGFAQFDGEFSLSGSSFAGAGGLRVTW